jgi:isocitrate lyase
LCIVVASWRTDNFLSERLFCYPVAVLGVTRIGVPSLQETIATGGCQEAWAKSAVLMTFGEAVIAQIDSLSVPLARKEQMRSRWMASEPETLSNASARKVADSIFGKTNSVFFDWELCRVREGYYQVRAGIEYCIQRGRAYGPYCDLIWMETTIPSVEDARQFSVGVHKYHPEQKLAYNLSPSFNWDASGMTDAQLSRFNDDLGRLGYVWQFITLAGFHSNGLVITKLARSFGDEGMLAYVRDIQRQEREHQIELLKHQTWSGAELVDQMVTVASGGASSTAAMGAGVTEAQFGSH